jgi:homoserine acetyltransferase
MNEIAILEKIVGGSLGGMVVLTIVSWKLWQRLGEKDAQSAAITREFLTAVAALRETVRDNTQALDGLREAIERGEHRAPRPSRLG